MCFKTDLGNKYFYINARVLGGSLLEGEAMLTIEELKRYDRQIKVFGVEVQTKLKRARVAIIGAGGLGSPAAYYLAAMGVGTIKIIDYDKVSLSNLNRQILHWTNDIGRDKVLSAYEKLSNLNPHVKIIPIKEKVTRENAEELLRDVDLCIDALDNWESKLLLNDVCVKYRKPLIHAGVRGTYGQMLLIIPGKTPCLRCFLTEDVMREEERLPVLGVTPGVLGTLQALEAVKLLTGYGKNILNKLLIFDGYELDFSYVEVKRNPQCSICGSI